MTYYGIMIQKLLESNISYIGLKVKTIFSPMLLWLNYLRFMIRNRDRVTQPFKVFEIEMY